MAISADTVFEVRTGGSDDNSGGFVTGASGVDRSQQDAPHATLTTAATVHTTTTQLNVPGGEHTVHADDIGNIFQLGSGGTATPGYYQITAVDTGNNRWTVDRSMGTAAQTAPGRMGGALATPGAAAAAATVNGNLIWVKAGTYTLATSTPGKGGPVLLANNTNAAMEGYTTTRGDHGGRPTLAAGAQTGVTLFACQGNPHQRFSHLHADGDSGAGNVGFLTVSSGHAVIDSVAQDCATGFSVTVSTGLAFGCKASGCTTGFSVAGGLAVKCWADACGTGFSASGSGQIQACLATDCSGVGLSLGGTGISSVGCAADGNAGDGFDLLGARGGCLECVSTNNGGAGFDAGTTTGTSPNFLDHCASYNNTSGRGDVPSAQDQNAIILTADPWVNAAADDYRPNDTAGGGAELRGASYGVLGQTDNADISAVQHTDPAATGGGLRIAGHGGLAA